MLIQPFPSISDWLAIVINMSFIGNKTSYLKGILSEHKSKSYINHDFTIYAKIIQKVRVFSTIQTDAYRKPYNIPYYNPFIYRPKSFNAIFSHMLNVESCTLTDVFKTFQTVVFRVTNHVGSLRQIYLNFIGI